MLRDLVAIRGKVHTAAAWAADTRIYPRGLLLQESDTLLVKKADGVHKFSELSYIDGFTIEGDLLVSDDAYDETSWDNALEVPTKNAVRDAVEGIKADYLPRTGGTLTGDLIVPDDVYDADVWDGLLEVPTKNSLRGIIEDIKSDYLPLAGIGQFVAPSGDVTGVTDTTNILAALAAVSGDKASVLCQSGAWYITDTVLINATTSRLKFNGTVALDNVGSHSDTTVTWVGGAAPVFQITGAGGTGSVLSGFKLNNTGTATVGIDLDNGAGFTAIEDIVCDTPTVPFSVAGVRVGNSGNVVDARARNVTFRASAPIGLQLLTVKADFLGDHVRFMQHSVLNLQVGGGASQLVDNARFVNNSTFETAENLTAIQVLNCKLLTFEGGYGEIGGSGYFLDIPATAILATQVIIENIWMTANTGSSASYVCNVNLATATIEYSGGYVTGLANPGYVVHNQSCANIQVHGVYGSSAGFAPVDSPLKAQTWENYSSSLGRMLDPIGVGIFSHIESNVVVDGLIGTLQTFATLAFPTSAKVGDRIIVRATGSLLQNTVGGSFAFSMTLGGFTLQIPAGSITWTATGTTRRFQIEICIAMVSSASERIVARTEVGGNAPSVFSAPNVATVTGAAVENITTPKDLLLQVLIAGGANTTSLTLIQASIEHIRASG